MASYTSFAEATFGKQLHSLTKDEITNFFSEEQEENLSLEFKSYHPSQNYKTQLSIILEVICSFLNSAGGLVIWGAPESSKSATDSTIIICKGSLTPINKTPNRDNIINSIISRIQSMPQGVDMAAVEVEPGKFVYLFEVQESPNKPHQFEGIYFTRSGTRTDRAPHDLVYALCRQIQVPELDCEVRLNRAYTDPEPPQIPMTLEFYLDFSNKTEIVNEHEVYLKIEAPNGSITVEENALKKGFRNKCFINNTIPILSHGLVHTKSCEIKYPSLQTSCVVTIWLGGKYSKAKKYTFNFSVERGPYKVDGYLTYHTLNVVTTT